MHVTGPTGHPVLDLIETAQVNGLANVTGSSRTMTGIVEVLGSTDIDALIFPTEWADAVRAARVSFRTSSSPALIMYVDRPSAAHLVRAIACGFDGTISADIGPVQLVARINDIVAGNWRPESEPVLNELGITQGFLARDLIVREPDDHHLLDLVGVGLPDEDVAVVLDLTVQHVRNRIEALLVENGLAFRTQLAVARAASLKFPEII